MPYKTLVTISVNLHNKETPAKIKAYALNTTRETGTDYYFFASNKKNIYKFQKSRLNIPLKSRQTLQYKYSFVTEETEYRKICDLPEIQKAKTLMLKQLDKELVNYNKARERLVSNI